ncbi:MAG: glycosyltransferase family 4 protein [Lachnospiraceae bacterium]|nr:glycosyltransferase family 4 protein [Lachnospiraceae bacterium]
MKKRKVAVVNQRYGLEVNGGSEYHAMILAQHLADFCDVEIITTCAKDYDTWENYYEPGEDVVNGIKVHRFPVLKQREQKRFQKCEKMRVYLPHLTYRMEQKWIDEQGPYAPDAITYIREHAEEYDVFIFVTYLYYLTVMGLKEVAQKSILIPTAHDEPFLKMKHYKELFQAPRGYFFNTIEERDMIYRKFHTEHIPNEIGGVGIEVPANTNPEGFKEKYHLKEYMIYVGRIDYGKNCHVLFDYFSRYKDKHPGDLKLVLMGKEMMDVPARDDILSLGFVSEEEKYDGMSGADFLILPSEFESMSIVVLDSLKLGVPVLVNGKCTVLKAHCDKSGGGFYYSDYRGFEEGIDKLLESAQKRKSMGMSGKTYVDEYYQWDAIMKRLLGLMDRILDT